MVRAELLAGRPSRGGAANERVLGGRRPPAIQYQGREWGRFLFYFIAPGLPIRVYKALVLGGRRPPALQGKGPGGGYAAGAGPVRRGSRGPARVSAGPGFRRDPRAAGPGGLSPREVRRQRRLSAGPGRAVSGAQASDRLGSAIRARPAPPGPGDSAAGPAAGPLPGERGRSPGLG